MRALPPIRSASNGRYGRGADIQIPFALREVEGRY